MVKGQIYGYLISLIGLFLTGCQEKQVPTLFREIPPTATNVLFTNMLQETDSFNINEYLYAYNGAGVAVGDVNNDGLPDIYFAANQSANHLFINRGDFVFADQTEQAGVAGWGGSEYWTSGVSMVDLNSDGWLDIYVNQVSGIPQLKGHNLLFLNNQDGTFSEASAKYGLDFQTFAQQTAFFDYDLDGDLDAYLLNHSLHEKNVYVKAENRNERDTLAGDRLLRNDKGYFVEVSAEAGIYGSPTGYGLSVSVADVDNNGYPDIYVGNDFHENDYLYLNQGDGTFKEDIRRALSYCSTFSMGSDIADLNNDGLLDLMTLDMKPEDEIIRKQSSGADAYEIFNYKLSFGYHEQYSRNMLHLNQGQDADDQSHFSEVGQLAGVATTDWSWSVLLADLDNDRHKDIFITNGILRRPNDLDYINYTFHRGNQNNTPALQLVELMPPGIAPNYAFKNQGNSRFEDVSSQWGLDKSGYSMGAAYADLDLDGDLDLVVNHLNAPSSLYRNTTSEQLPHHYLKVKLDGPSENRFGLGARVSIFLEGQESVQEIQPVRGWLSSSDYTLVFGLGDTQVVDSVVVRWPSGKTQSLSQVPANQTIQLRVQEADTPPKEEQQISPWQTVSFAEPLFQHRENDFIDFSQEILLPHKLSNLGPCLAKADINGDGREDLFVGGAVGQAGVFLIQDDSAEKLIQRIPAALQKDSLKEDVAAAFFDADQDGDPDLYVVSGGSQFQEKEKNRDRLYLNDGTGQFTPAPNFVAPTSNGACVVAADFNQDGKTDLFVGSRSVVGKYGQLPDAHLLWNRGGGQFARATSDDLSEFGMVTDAVWDAQNQELWIVGEWMPLTRLSFSGEQWTKRTISQSSGWWNTIHAADLDQDGDMDFLLGNHGWNSPLQPAPERPLGLIVNDWDRNGQPDPLLTYYRQGTEWLYNGLDQVKKQIPPIRVKYPTYDKYAVHTVEQFFAEAKMDTAQMLRAETFASGLIRKDGSEGYQLTALPVEAQNTAIHAFLAHDFDGDQQLEIIALGNNSGNTPSIGNQMASLGCYLKKTGEAYQVIPNTESGFYIKGEVRAIETLQVRNETWLVIAKNNAPLQIVRYRKDALLASPRSDQS